MHSIGAQFEALAFLAAAFSLFAIAACVKLDGTMQRMRRAINRLERHVGFKETKEIRFKEFREMLENIEKEYERNRRNGLVKWEEEDVDDRSD